jgi:hypothetical protein
VDSEKAEFIPGNGDPLESVCNADRSCKGETQFVEVPGQLGQNNT